MEAWAWLAAYVLGFGFLQLLLYRYFQREYSGADATPGAVEGSGPVATEPSRDVADGRTCSDCGTVNEAEATYTYCRECASPLR